MQILTFILKSRDYDEYTKRFYMDNANIPIEQLSPLVFHSQANTRIEQDIPPYNGFGTVEDSLGSCKYLVLKPPKKDFIKTFENEHKILRFVACMV